MELWASLSPGGGTGVGLSALLGDMAAVEEPEASVYRPPGPCGPAEKGRISMHQERRGKQNTIHRRTCMALCASS